MSKPSFFHCKECTSKEGSVFCDLKEAQLDIMDEAKICNVYRPHQMIFYEGNLPYGLYCIVSGKVKIYKMDKEGHQHIVRLLGPGEMVGYRCLLANEPYSATAETLEETQVCFIDKKSLFHILESHPATAFHVMCSLAKDLGKAEYQMVNIVHKNIRERLAELLLVFLKKYGKKEEKGIRLNISLTREEMAELIGSTQESVIRLMSEFKQDGIIAVDGRSITILNAEKLVKTANVSDGSTA